jgi:hypothetical protein
MSHYIRTIQTSFTSGLSSPSSAWSSSTPQNFLVSIPSMNYPPGISQDWRGLSGSNASSPSLTYNSHSRRRTSVNLRPPTPIHRRPAPPPPTTPTSSSYSRTQPASTTYIKFDPFADENNFDPLPSSVIYHTSPRSSLVVRPEPLHHTIRIPPATMTEQRPFDKEARAKLVAGILLNRAQVGKPPRRRSIEPKTYIKSGLSSVVSVEA